MSALVNLPPNPDLLRRFVPRRHSVLVELDGVPVLVESNDEKILAALASCGRKLSGGLPRLRCALLRDDGGQRSASAPTLLRYGCTTVLRFGAGTQLVVDSEAGEIAGYIGSDMEPDLISICVVPQIVRAAKGQRQGHK